MIPPAILVTVMAGALGLAMIYFVVETKALHRARREVLDYDVGPVGNLARQLTPFCGCQVNRDAQLRCVEVVHEVTAIDARNVVFERRQCAHKVNAR